ncbi:ABC transporter ATP-binding/permease protein like [Quillaja saponaria]|uniref:ABC transporter ATP-binding/permease protein like n=1 Tax=Quillaja saponaria TaxID=32244 RepID=A0AAD7Q716_QUISA|nr:ABC transporter ATP-binding/permease protein like [Quillaja saponaria]
MDSAASASVQHVNKKSSDELLRKFAELDNEAPAKKDLRLAKRRRKLNSRAIREGGDQYDNPSNGSTRLVERRSLLPPAVTRRSALLRQLGIGRSQLRARDIRNKSLMGTIEKTWRRTVEGAYKVFMEKHYNQHRRLINDIV